MARTYHLFREADQGFTSAQVSDRYVPPRGTTRTETSPLSVEKAHETPDEPQDSCLVGKGQLPPQDSADRSQEGRVLHDGLHPAELAQGLGAMPDPEPAALDAPQRSLHAKVIHQHVVDANATGV